MPMDVFEAIDAGDLERVAEIVQQEPAAAGARNQQGLSAVLAAQYRHRRDIVDVLLAAGPELDVFDAAAVGDVHRLQTILDDDPAQLDAYASDGFFPLALAAYFGHPHAVRLLLERGADVNARARNAMQVQALHAAVAGRNHEAIRLLLDAHADPNATQHGGWTPLMAAAQHGDEQLLGLLLAHGAEPTPAAADQARKAGHTALSDRLQELSGNRSTTS